MLEIQIFNKICIEIRKKILIICTQKNEIIGKLTCSQGGHKLTNQLLRKVFENDLNFSIIEVKENKVPHSFINKRFLKSIA